MKKSIPSNNFFSANSIVKQVIELKWLIGAFVIFLVFQLYQASLLLWDSIPYVFQGKWFCGQQIYFEFIRPPLPGFFNCIFGANISSIFVTVAFSSILYFIAIALLFLKEKKHLDQFVLALFAFLLPPVLMGFNFGSDLLALAFLFLAFAVSKPAKKGLLFGLATLSRYNFIIFIPIFLWEQRKKPSRILIFLAPVVLLWLPWIIFNFLYTGDPFFSINESFYLNVLNKGSFAFPSIEQITFLVIFAATFLFSGALKRLSSDQKNQSGLLSAVQFLFAAVKETRFMNVVFPALAFNAARLGKNKKYKITLSIVFILFVIIFYVLFLPSVIFSLTHVDNVPTDSFLYSCRVASDKWVLFYPKGIVAEWLPDSSRYDEYLTKGVTIVLYGKAGFDINSISVPGVSAIDRGDYLILKPSACASQPKTYISGPWSYKVINWLRDTNSVLYNPSTWGN